MRGRGFAAPPSFLSLPQIEPQVSLTQGDYQTRDRGENIAPKWVSPYSRGERLIDLESPILGVSGIRQDTGLSEGIKDGDISERQERVPFHNQGLREIQPEVDLSAFRDNQRLRRIVSQLDLSGYRQTKKLPWAQNTENTGK